MTTIDRKDSAAPLFDALPLEHMSRVAATVSPETFRRAVTTALGGSEDEIREQGYGQAVRCIADMMRLSDPVIREYGYSQAWDDLLIALEHYWMKGEWQPGPWPVVDEG